MAVLERSEQGTGARQHADDRTLNERKVRRLMILRASITSVLFSDRGAPSNGKVALRARRTGKPC
jgi:hypothetical protein